MYEKYARDTYKSYMLHKHNGFDVNDSGLVINPTWAYIGASPDGTVKCNCCTNGISKLNINFVTEMTLYLTVQHKTRNFA